MGATFLMWPSVTFRNFYCICRTIRAERNLSYHYAFKTGCHVAMNYVLKPFSIVNIMVYTGVNSYGKMLLLFNSVDDYATI